MSRLWRRSMNNNAICFIQDLENTGKKRIKFLIHKSRRTEKVIGNKYQSRPIALLSACHVMSGKQIVTQASWPMYPHFIWVLVSRDLLSHINVSMVSFLQSLLLLFHFCVFLSQLSELVWKLAEEISLQSAPKRFPSFGPPANGNESTTKKSRFRANRNLTGTIYHWSVILRSFSVVLNLAKRDANGFFTVLLLSSHLLISRHPVRKSKFVACAVTGYCPF